MYGADEKRRGLSCPAARVFPKLVSWNRLGRKYVSFKDCSFAVKKGRESTARVVVVRKKKPMGRTYVHTFLFLIIAFYSWAQLVYKMVFTLNGLQDKVVPWSPVVSSLPPPPRCLPSFILLLLREQGSGSACPLLSLPCSSIFCVEFSLAHALALSAIIVVFLRKKEQSPTSTSMHC